MSIRLRIKVRDRVSVRIRVEVKPSGELDQPTRDLSVAENREPVVMVTFIVRIRIRILVHRGNLTLTQP